MWCGLSGSTPRRISYIELYLLIIRKKYRAMTFLDKFTVDQVKEIIAQSQSISQALRLMGHSPHSGAQHMLLKQFCKSHNIDTSHFRRRSTRYTDEEIFQEHSVASQTTLHRRAKQLPERFPYKCAICGLIPFWNNMELELILDHINGVTDDARYENLRWVCPNCNHQLPTFGSRNYKRKPRQIKYCVRCGATLYHRNASGLCANCIKAAGGHTGAQKKHDDAVKRRAELGITREVLKDCIRTESFTQIAKRYSVTFNTIRRWCKTYGLPDMKTKIMLYSDDEWSQI